MTVIDVGDAAVGGTQSIQRAVKLLRHIAAHDLNGVRLIDAMRALDMQRSTTHRILQCLVAEGLLAVKSPGQRYVLGSLAFELGLRAARRERLREACRPSLERIAQHSGDVVFLSVRRAAETVCLDRAEGNYPVRAFTREMGDRRPIGFGAVGISILALLPDAEVERILEDGAEILRAYNGHAPADAWLRVQDARQRGYAFHERETHGLRAIALPVRDPSGQPFAAFSLCAISSRLTDARADEMAAFMRSEIGRAEVLLNELES